ncbi:DUF962 domain-containing protein [bacterium]|nr:DUF962 domain-containing protein [bacterium]
MSGGRLFLGAPESMSALMLEAELRRRFEEYESYHHHSTNQRLHYVGVPLIMLGLLGLLARIPLWGQVDGGLALWLLAAVYYAWIARRLGLMFAGFSFLVYWIGHIAPLSVLVLSFIGGWGIQALGHARFERNSPAFFKNLEHLLIGPLWLFSRLLGGRL